ncbi:MAG: OsmC family protein [Acetobacteraceae bacterium]
MEPEPQVVVRESGAGPYGQLVFAGHHVAAADEPERVGGLDTGMSPYEYLLAGLGACTAMTLRMYAARHDWPLESTRVGLRHVAEAGGGDRFEREITLTGPLSAEQRAKLLEIADKCPVSRTLSRASRVVSRLTEPA